MNIATALNKKYVLYTIVMLTSLCENNPGHIDAYLLNNELGDDDFRKMRESLSRYDVTCIDTKVDKDWFDSRCPHTEEWSMETYYRLLLPDLLPAEVDRLLYLDVDLIINQSLDELYGMDMEGKDLWAADNTNGTTTPELMMPRQREMFAPFMSEGFRYFNAGVLLMDMKQIREKYGTETYVRAMAEWEYAMDCPDQDILNWVHRDSVGYIPWRRYDLFSKHAHQIGITYDDVKKDTAIVHFAGSKPWNTTNLHYDIEQLWWDYARLTPCYRELLEALQQSVMADTSVEKQIREMADANKRLTEISRTLAERVKQTEAVSVEQTGESEAEQISRAYLNHVSVDPASSAVIPPRGTETVTADLSVIIPCYNVEQYVADCIESVLSQPMKHSMELILIDDGSSDKTGDVLDHYAGRDGVTVISQENRGLSGARNSGLNAARGRYILFLDSDDRLVQDSLDELLIQAQTLDTDIIEGGTLQQIDGQILPVSDRLKEQTPKLVDPSALSGYAWGKLIRRSLFERIQFPEGYLFEDSIITWLLLPRSERIAVSSLPFYIYRRNQEGITASAREGNPKTIDTWWITEQMQRDLEGLYLRISPTLFDTALSQVALNYIRTAALGEEVKVAVFHLTCGWFRRNFAGCSTEKAHLQIVEKALRMKNYVIYEQACATAWRAICSMQ